MKKLLLLLNAICFSYLLIGQDNKTNSQVFAIGAMKEVKHGNLEATTHIKQEQGIQHMYGLGPLDSLTGEITIVDGIIYQSTVKDGSPIVTQVPEVKAPFFVLSEVANWNSSVLKKDIQTLSGIEAYLLMAYHIYQKPFAFQIRGTFDSLTYHIQNRVGGSPLSQPFDMHEHQVTYQLNNVSGTLIGFYSATHEGVFTHKGKRIHVHFISDDKKHMGHVDKLSIGNNTVQLLLPR